MGVKKMIEMYLAYNLDEATWDMMYQMALHGLISNENWEKFYEKCKGWTFSEDGNAIEDFDGTVLYLYDDNGYLVRA